MDSIREQIIQAIFVRLETITTANGYNVSVADNANRAKAVLDEEDLPALSLWAGTETTTSEYGADERKMVIDINTAMQVEDETISDDAMTNQMIADIQKCMGTHDTDVYNLIDGMKETNTEPIYRDTDSKILSVLVTYEITYTTVKGDPYSKP
ncbi:MAG: hypothetical protein KZQ83_14940 [gamma proteobacterium symbiont of Taylorina sp.]|nr:hypothetical protein [gamma proteobacterium symbiont of Taylorina sp.]